jgi:hypothetical protein
MMSEGTGIGTESGSTNFCQASRKGKYGAPKFRNLGFCTEA